MLVVLTGSLAPGSGCWPGSSVGFPARGKFGSFKTCFVFGDLNKNGLVGDTHRLLLEMACLQISIVCFHSRQNLFLVSYKSFLIFIFASFCAPLAESNRCQAGRCR